MTERALPGREATTSLSDVLKKSEALERGEGLIPVSNLLLYFLEYFLLQTCQTGGGGVPHAP